MNQAIRKLSGLLVLPVLLAALLLLPVSAKAEEYACDAAIPVTMQLNGTHSEKFEVTIECAEDADENQPMPAADNQALMLADEEQGCFTIHYTEPGDYFYIVRQTAGSTAYMSYDLTVYEIQVQVTNATAADGSTTLKAQVVANDVENPEAKAAEVSFLNTFAPPTPTPAPAVDEHPDIAEGIANGTWGGAPTATPGLLGIPQTSDSLPLTALVVVLVVAAAAIVALVILRKRSDKKEDGQQ